MSAQRRLMADLTALQREPLIGASAAPVGRDACSDITLWDAAILIPLPTASDPSATVPLYFLIDFPPSYPNKAPSIGFQYRFPYRMGATMTVSSGRLSGKMAICLDILGNFDFVHTEWKSQVGSGWSPAYGVTTLLLQLQSLVCSMYTELNVHEREQLRLDAENFLKKNPESRLDFLDRETLERRKHEEKQLEALCLGDEGLKSDLKALLENAIADAASGSESCATISASNSASKNVEKTYDKAIKTLWKLVHTHRQSSLTNDKNSVLDDGTNYSGDGSNDSSGTTVSSSGSTTSAQVKSMKIDQTILTSVKKNNRAVDLNIKCYNLGKSYTEDVLGVLVRWDKNKIVSPCEFLSAEAFFEGGLRQSTSKETFTHFLPVWINPQDHAHTTKGSKWRSTLETSLSKIYSLDKSVDPYISKVSSLKNKAILSIYPRVLNGLLVDLFDENIQKSAAIAYFEAFVNFWRTFRYLLEEDKKLQATAVQRLTQFASDESARHKDSTPDVGMILALYITAIGLPGMPAERDFVQAYVDESFLRGAMWWKRNYVNIKDKQEVFEATDIGRSLLMFQLLAKDVLLLGNIKTEEEDFLEPPSPADNFSIISARIQAAKSKMDESNCTVPSILEKLLADWKKCKATVIGWPQFFAQIGLVKPPFASAVEWFAEIVQRAEQKGPKYGNGGGKGGKQGRRF